MSSLRGILLVVLLAAAGVASGQSPGVIYTWAGTGNVHDWVSTSDVNVATVVNTVDGELTITETGDPVFGDEGGTLVIRDGNNRRLESSTASGGLDLTGLEFIELDVAHNGAGNVNVQFFTQVNPAFLYTWAGNNGTRNGPDFSLGPGMHTLQYPLGILTPAEQAHIKTIGLRVRDHFAEGNLTWTIKEMRSTGTPLTLRDLATHDTGSSDGGLQGAFANYDIGAIVGNNGGQNQTGLSHNPAGSGSLQWTDRGGAGTPESPSGAAIGWGNGTTNASGTFGQRLTDVSNYTHVTYRVSATDPLGAGSELGLQAYFQTGNFNDASFRFQSAGNTLLPIDGAFHDLTFPLALITDRQNVQFSGLKLFNHTNDLMINVDLIRYDTIEGVQGDYNENGVVDAADYTLWRNNVGQPATALKNRNPLNSGDIGQDDYDFWKSRFGATSGSGAGAVPVPEPAAWLLGLCGAAFSLSVRRRSTC